MGTLVAILLPLAVLLIGLGLILGTRVDRVLIIIGTVLAGVVVVLTLVSNHGG